MIRIRGTLLPENVLLDIDAKSVDEAVKQVTESLRRDNRISNWAEFIRNLRSREATGKTYLGFGITLPHIRTSSVNNMVMAVGRTAQPLYDGEVPIRFVVLVGIPRTMDSDYLRLLGNLMRVFRDEQLRDKLLDAQDPAEVIRIFERGETK
ncbi:MAG TPA: PTS sugar transporter subunit IIA [Chthoniobacterales bacterium]|jgi:mannitol/fructose-specific phosphotransferase system IIA component (Ntr-type)|nr:PTS sugar transporter subunit IIA [Chthoniobacterales bacterium]